ncbi:MAG TPA: DNA glycosylase [Candidatus Acidoferrales bacterium]|jgi:N-glycosylase/DNA lyase|nr:DNA glycosylase [Candidatus Acidoferrales bacterium]
METFLPVRDYDLAATLESGQVFRWQREGDTWTGVLDRHSLRLTQKADGIHVQAAASVTDWRFLHEFLQSDIDLGAILKTFPDDGPMRDAVVSCPGLRLLRQDPWECLASFILSSTKQIVQIRQIVALLCERYGEPIAVMQTTPRVGRVAPRAPLPANKRDLVHHDGAHGVTRPTTSFTFPTPQRLAAASEAELRACKMGFRAPGLLAAARAIADGKLNLESLRQLNYFEARTELMKLRGVGGKIADCVLLFAYGFDSAFPVDVWIERALQELYFPRRRASDKRLRKFAATHFGPHAGYAQQYLFHYMRTKVK